jgi:hypothetical protein
VRPVNRQFAPHNTTSIAIITASRIARVDNSRAFVA